MQVRRLPYAWIENVPGQRDAKSSASPAGVNLQIAARHADPRTTTIYDRRRQSFDHHAAYVVVAFVAGG